MNINTEPVARAFVQVGEALCDDNVDKVVLLAHSQGTIISGDVLDLIYTSFDDAYFELTNMLPEEREAFIDISFSTVPKTRVLQVMEKLKKHGPDVAKKLELYLFANAASRMRYLFPKEKRPHIESFANHHDIVSRLGVLAIDELHEQDLLHIDGSLFTLNSYGHLLNCHYLLNRFERGQYTLTKGVSGTNVSTSVHDPVHGNPCTKNPEYIPGPSQSRLMTYL